MVALQPRLVGEAGELDQPREPRAPAGAEVLQAVLHEQSVLVHQRHHVGDGAERGQADRPQERLAEPGGDPARSARPRGDRPGELEGHAGAAQVAERIRGAGQARVHEHVGRGELVGEGVVVGDDQLQAEVAGAPGLGAGLSKGVEDGGHGAVPKASRGLATPRLSGA